MKKDSVNPRLVIGLILLVILLAVTAVLGVQVSNLAHQAAEEAASTPTPVPPYGNAMLITPDPNATPAPQILRVGSQGEEVRNLQSRLQTLGYYSGVIDGQYGNGTREAVYAFQQANGIPADGLAGSQTCELLYSPYAKSANYVSTPTPTVPPAETAEPAAAMPVEEEEVLTADGGDFPGFPLLVNETHPLPEGYTPRELVNMTDYCDRKLVTIKANGIEGERIAVDALMEMLRAAHEDGITTWQISAGWRSVAYQQKLFDNQVYKYRKDGYSAAKAKAATKKTIAEPGCSEHHTGLAFDITVPGTAFKGTKQAAWLAEHCWDYGFILRYQDDKKELTGITGEPWHFRYVGREHALIMRDENLCLEEYVALYGG
ncbi:MAG: D-alanyl-D-alanine carboxypeptidase family protein [Clostridia bacterium]|nr:D-alanyl-D-alanine carboxypeptidase family protein [Clostridia bacterium]